MFVGTITLVAMALLYIMPYMSVSGLLACQEPEQGRGLQAGRLASLVIPTDRQESVPAVDRLVIAYNYQQDDLLFVDDFVDQSV